MHPAPQAVQDAVLLDTVPYAASGPFAVNLWMRRLPGANLNGSYYSYLYSHTGDTINPSGQSPNQVGRHAVGVVAVCVGGVVVGGAGREGGRVQLCAANRGRPRTRPRPS